MSWTQTQRQDHSSLFAKAKHKARCQKEGEGLHEILWLWAVMQSNVSNLQIQICKFVSCSQTHKLTNSQLTNLQIWDTLLWTHDDSNFLITSWPWNLRACQLCVEPWLSVMSECEWETWPFRNRTWITIYFTVTAPQSGHYLRVAKRSLHEHQTSSYYQRRLLNMFSIMNLPNDGIPVKRVHSRHTTSSSR